MRWLAFAMLPAALLVTGCTARAVEFSLTGDPHCPYCLVQVEGRSDRCASCGNPYRWAAERVPCWNCGGAKVCPVCEGSGKNPADLSCWGCKGSGEGCPVEAAHSPKLATARAGEDCHLCYDKASNQGTGLCPFCDADGFIEYGGDLPTVLFDQP
ncbi:MAG: hypothetical protein HY722_02405 [Planctomycetes bacterium]|nr:hypothetical protein [Planctomycetota bacterium]